MNADVPPFGQSPYAQQPPPPPLPGSSSRWGPTTLGIDPAIAAGLGYLFGGHFAGILPIIWLVAEKRNRFIRFHAAQALLLIAATLVGFLAAGIVLAAGLIVGAVVGSDARVIGGVLAAIGVALMVLLSISVLVLDIWGIIAGFSGKYVKFPLIGGIAERLVGGPPAPLF
jgi:uncharacterized membrane protein